MADRFFSRAISIRIPVYPGSGNDPFDMIEAGIPVYNDTGKIRDDLYFAFINETPFDVRLQGFSDGAAFEPVGQNSKSWSILARVDKGPFLSKKPLTVSVAAFSTPGNPIPEDIEWFDSDGDPIYFLEMNYGMAR